MTSLEKAINLGYLFLTLKPPKKQKNISIRAPLSAACIGMFQFIQQSVFDPNTCSLNWVPLTGTVDVHLVNCPIWGWNNTVPKSNSSTFRSQNGSETWREYVCISLNKRVGFGKYMFHQKYKNSLWDYIF